MWNMKSSHLDSSSANEEARSISPQSAHGYRCLANRINDRIEGGTKFFSLEFFPPRTLTGASNLIEMCNRMGLGGPLFCDITWKVGGDNRVENPTSTLTIANTVVNYCGLDTVMHMTCVGQTKSQISDILVRAKDLGIRNILALRGDLPPECDNWAPSGDGFTFAADLVRFIRSSYGDYFTIAVAGYPNGHPDCSSYHQDLQHLKEKVEAGASFIITQLFFRAEMFINFVKDCRAIGISCPILPGILPIQAYASLKNISKLSKLEVPQEILDSLLSFKDDDEAVRQFGISYCSEMCRQLLDSEYVCGLHFYTMNREFATVQILKNLGLWKDTIRRSLPWKTSANPVRCMEEVRPIFWSSRPQSYIYRTSDWDEFPNGRWGNSASASFRDLTDYYLFGLTTRPPKAKLLEMWGTELKSEQDVWDVFSCFLSGEKNKQGVMVTCIPWCDESLSAETSVFVKQLISVNQRGVLTINSQPNVNCAPSSDPVHGWGNPGGYVFQKAYLEFFTSKENVEHLKVILKDYPRVNYHIVDSKYDTDYTNCHELQPIAVTWGIFPSKEVVQPTVVDPVAFKSWKDEAFSLWLEHWGKLYDEGTVSRNIINNFVDNYCLVNLVDNDFVKESCLFEIVHKMLSAASFSDV